MSTLEEELKRTFERILFPGEEIKKIAFGESVRKFSTHLDYPLLSFHFSSSSPLPIFKDSIFPVFSFFPGHLKVDF